MLENTLPVPQLDAVTISPDGASVVFSFQPYVFPDGVMGAHLHCDGTDETTRHVIGMDSFDPDAFAAGSITVPFDPIHGTDVTCTIEANANLLSDGSPLYAKSNAVVLSQAVIQAALQSAKKGHGHK